MVPKALALQQSRATALRVTPPMQAFQIAAYPFVVALNGLGNALLRLAGIDRSTASTEHFRTPEELAFVVQESRAGGLLREGAAHVLHELLELGELTAAEVMLPRVHVFGIPAGAGDDLIADLFRREPHARYPVYEESLDNIVGMVHVKDLLRARVRGEPLARAQVRPVAFLPLNASVDDILAAMRKTRSQLVVIMDEHGGTAGIVTLEDVFEEVVGEVTDDTAEPAELRPAGAGRIRAHGTARIDEVATALGIVLDFEDADTVSGLVLALLKRPPLLGDRVVWEEATFEVTAVRGHGVEECIVSLEDVRE
jgi:CBS domain containing-hemolysin-like protein